MTEDSNNTTELSRSPAGVGTGVAVARPSPSARTEPEELYFPRPRKKLVPFILFFLTCCSTFWVGITNWQPMQTIEECFRQGSTIYLRQLVLAHWDQGLWYMGGLLAILLFHELGHFFATIIYRIEASMPIFLPFPLNPIGTLGAVIAMQGTKANRKQIFDIGIAGPLAGLVVAVPLAWYGVSQLDLSAPPRGGLGFNCPLAIDWMIRWYGVEGYDGQAIWLSQLNPFFAAAWVGFLVTGLNMIPVGQLDGGHITYTLFGRQAHWLAEAIVILAIATMVYLQNFIFVVMVVLLILVGTRHPPTSDDTVPLGWFRWTLGLASLAIPFVCFPPMVFSIVF